MTLTPITKFKEEYRRASIFFAISLVLQGSRFPTVEHAYQYYKTLNPQERAQILACVTLGQAKRRGRKVTCRPERETLSVLVMTRIVHAKFQQNPDLLAKLLATG